MSESASPVANRSLPADRKGSVRTDVGQPGAITPVPRLPQGSSVVEALIEDLFPFYDDGSEAIQHMVARLPLLLEGQRAYVGRLSADGKRFTVTHASTGDWPDLLGYTQSVARLPAFARGSLQSGVQGTIEDSVVFPFTPQQRKMHFYADLGATILTPIPTIGGIAGALVLDQMVTQRPWEPSTLESCKSIAEALGARFALAQLGDHLATETAGAERETSRLSVLANIARLLQRADDVATATDELLALLEGLPWVGAVRSLSATDGSTIIREALANETNTVRTIGSKTIVGIPLIFGGQKFGGFEVMLEERLTDFDAQFWRTVQTFASSAYASALRRGRPRDEALVDSLTGLSNYRSINEALVDAVHAAKSSGRPVSAWIVDIEGLDAVNRSLGYATGDDIVGYVGNTLGSIVTSRGTVGRFGGGMFLAIFPGMDAEETSVQARMTVERIVKNAPGHLPTVALTIGASVYPAQATGPDDLIRSARLALYAAKSRGANAVEVAKMKDDGWMQSARTAFIRIVTEHQLPAAMTQIRK
jgi:diguanylate cyclase (GGDEF)-like protein